MNFKTIKKLFKLKNTGEPVQQRKLVLQRVELLPVVGLNGQDDGGGVPRQELVLLSLQLHHACRVQRKLEVGGGKRFFVDF